MGIIQVNDGIIGGAAPELTGRIRFREKMRWWSGRTLLVLQVEESYRQRAPLAAPAFQRGPLVRALAYWRDARFGDLVRLPGVERLLNHPGAWADAEPKP